MERNISLEKFNKDVEKAQKQLLKPKKKSTKKIKLSVVANWWKKVTNLQVYVGDVYENGEKVYENGQRTLILSNSKVTKEITLSTDYMKKVFGEEKCFIYKNKRDNKISVTKARNMKELNNQLKINYREDYEILGWTNEEELKSIVDKMNKELHNER